MASNHSENPKHVDLSLLLDGSQDDAGGFLLFTLCIELLESTFTSLCFLHCSRYYLVSLADNYQNPKTKYNLEYYLDFVAKLVDLKIDVLGIKDMAGTLRPKAARLLVGAIRKKYPELPIHVHTHGRSSIASNLLESPLTIPRLRRNWCRFHGGLR